MKGNIGNISNPWNNRQTKKLTSHFTFIIYFIIQVNVNHGTVCQTDLTNEIRKTFWVLWQH